MSQILYHVFWPEYDVTFGIFSTKKKAEEVKKQLIDTNLYEFDQIEIKEVTLDQFNLSEWQD